ncbi:MAG: signal peptidase I [Bdellovibrionales bacterium]|nr:signal peptidase I [Bdellovibrionales bacterium]
MWKSFKDFCRSPWGSFILAISAAIIFRQSVASPYKIPSGSMIPTLKIGDFIFVNKLSYALKLPIPYVNYNIVEFDTPKRGDVVVFIYPHDRSLDFIKRVVGLPGDKIEVRDDILYINDAPVNVKSYSERSIIGDQSEEVQTLVTLYKEKTGTAEHLIMQYPKAISDSFDPVVVPKDHLFAMGDNRDNSRDSRAWGFVPIKDVRGQAKFIWLSLDFENPYFSATLFGNVLAFPRIRWDRFGMKII